MTADSSDCFPTSRRTDSRCAGIERGHDDKGIERAHFDKGIERGFGSAGIEPGYGGGGIERGFAGGGIERAHNLDEYRFGAVQNQRSNFSPEYTVSNGVLYFGPIGPNPDRMSSRQFDQNRHQPQWFGPDGTIMESPNGRGAELERQTARERNNRRPDAGRERPSHGEPRGAGERVEPRQLFDYFRQNGFTPAQAAGILGNMQTESGFRTNAYNAHERAIGLCQWEGPRRTALERFATQQGRPVTDWHVQADFMMHELRTTESRAYAAIRASQTPEQAARAFQSRYERSASLGDRARNASNIYRQLA